MIGSEDLITSSRLLIYSGVEFLIVSHGIGSAGAAICFRELIKIGVKCIIRSGTAGSLQPEKHLIGDNVIVWAAGKEDGVSALSETAGMPAMATYEVVKQLEKTASALFEESPPKVGVTVTSDLFYPSEIAEMNTLKKWQAMKADVIEMEISTLFVICRHAGIDCGAVVCVDGSPLAWDEGNYDPTGKKASEGKENCYRIIFETIVALEETRKCSHTPT